MKLKLFLLCVLVFPYVLVAGDTINDHTGFMSPRNAVIEMFTNTGSVIGASSYGIVNDYIRKNPDGIIPIVYHTYSPYSGDPMYNINTEMNLNRWSHYAKLFDMSLDNSAAVGGHYFAQNRNDMDSLVRAINYQKAIVVPVKMAINMVKEKDSAEITVHIQAVGEYGKRTLYIYLMDSYYTNYELTRSDLPAPNQEVYFRWIPRAMIPDENGLEVKLYEGSDTTIKVKVPIRETDILSNKRLYATAVLQSPTSTNLIQAVTTYKPMRGKIYFQGREIQTGDSSYVKIKPLEKIHLSYTLENPYNYEIKYSVILYSKARIFYIARSPWDTMTYTLKPYEKKELKILVVSQDLADFARVDLFITPLNIPDSTYQQDTHYHSIFFVSENLHCATLHTYPKLEKDAEAIENLVREGSEDWAVMPYDVFMKGFSDMSVKLFYLMLDTRNIPTFGLNAKRVNFMQSLIEKGKGIIISSVFELAMAQNKYKNYNYITLPQMNTFLNDQIGITLANHYKIHNYQTINVFGVPENDFGKDVTIENAVINDGWVITQTNNAESIKINGVNLRTKGILRYDIADTPEDEYACVLSEVGNARIMYLGFGLENSAYYGKRNLLDNTMWWLMKGVRPKRARLQMIPADSIEFGTREIYTSTARKVLFKNIGDTVLHITGIEISPYGESFIFDTSAVVKTLEPGQSFELPLVFEPKKRQAMTAYLDVWSDAYYDGTPWLNLFGKGILSENKIPLPDEDEDYEDQLDIYSTNLSDKVNIKFEPNSKAKNVTITLIDGDGNRFNIPYVPNERSARQSMKFNKKLFENEKYELEIDIDGKIIRKSVNDYKSK
ncbi:MAG: hypothetical protein WCR42_14545 [bacterium]